MNGKTIFITITEGDGLGMALTYFQSHPDVCPEAEAALASIAKRCVTGDIGLDLDLFHRAEGTAEGEDDTP